MAQNLDAANLIHNPGGVYIRPVDTMRGILFGSYGADVPEEVLPILCEAWIPVMDQFVRARGMSGCISSLNELTAPVLLRPGKFSVGATTEANCIYPVNLRGGYQAKGFWLNKDEGGPSIPVRNLSFYLQSKGIDRHVNDPMLVIRGARFLKLTYSPEMDNQPMACLWPCGLFYWSWFPYVHAAITSGALLPRLTSSKIRRYVLRPNDSSVPNKHFPSIELAGWMAGRAAGYIPGSPEGYVENACEFLLRKLPVYAYDKFSNVRQAARPVVL